MKVWHLFVVMTILAWGAYIPTLHEGQAAIGGKSRALWGFLFVGIAYVIVAVIGPTVLLATRGELSPFPSTKGMSISMFAGALGSIGAFGIILSLMYGGKPTAVAPLVFAGAPIMATLVAMWLHRPSSMPDIRFFIGIALAAAGAAMVLRFKPS